MDIFAAESQARAKRTVERGLFADEILPVNVPQPKGEPLLVDADEHPRPDTTTERLARLSPAFKKAGSITAGNAAGINDGAAVVVVMSAPKSPRAGPKALSGGAKLRLGRGGAPPHGHRPGASGAKGPG